MQKVFERCVAAWFVFVITLILCIEVKIVIMHFQIKQDLREVKRITDSWKSAE